MLIHAEPVRASERSTCRTGSIYLLILALFSNPFTFSNLKSYPPFDILEIYEDTSIDANLHVNPCHESPDKHLKVSLYGIVENNPYDG